MKDSARAATLVAKAATWRELRFAMSDPDSHPMADWPDELQRLWNELVLSNELDSHGLPKTVLEAWDRVVQVQACNLCEAIDANRDLLDNWRAEDQLIFVSNAEPGVRRACGTQGLVKVYRTNVWAQGLCPRCFRRRLSWHVLNGGKNDSRSGRGHDG